MQQAAQETRMVSLRLVKSIMKAEKARCTVSTVLFGSSWMHQYGLVNSDIMVTPSAHYC